jgi:hypothetical protein
MVKPECYKESSYRQVIKRACRRLRIPTWRPNQLRHNAATVIRRQFGLEAARVILGHQAAATSEIYAEKDLAFAMDISPSLAREPRAGRWATVHHRGTEEIVEDLHRPRPGNLELASNCVGLFSLARTLPIDSPISPAGSKERR